MGDSQSLYAADILRTMYYMGALCMWNICKIGILVLALIGCEISLADPRSEQQKFDLNNSALKQSNAIQRIDSSLICQLFSQKEFPQLESMLLGAERAFKASAAYEFNFIRSYEAIANCENIAFIDKEKILNEWVRSAASASAFESRGFLYYLQAWKFRGNRYINETNKANLDVAMRYWELARQDLSKSIELNAELLPAYQRLIEIYSITSDIDAAIRTSQQAIKHVPATYYVRQSALEFLQPKWGRSYEEAEALIAEAQAHAEENNRLWGLRGYVDANKGRQCISDKNTVCAIAMYSKAVQYGDKFNWLAALAYSYYTMGRYKEASDCIKRIQIYLPNNAQAIKLTTVLDKLSSSKDAAMGSPGTQGSQQQVDALRWDDFMRDW